MLFPTAVSMIASQKYVLQHIFIHYFKANGSWVMGPDHVLHLLSLVRHQRESVQRALEPSLKRGSWYAHSEHILIRLLASEDPEDREWAVTKINNIRKKKDGRELRTRFGEVKMRPVNLQATSLKDLIDWDNCTEPPITVNLTLEVNIRAAKV